MLLFVFGVSLSLERELILDLLPGLGVTKAGKVLLFVTVEVLWQRQ
jgi:hypothetical protein